MDSNPKLARRLILRKVMIITAAAVLASICVTILVRLLLTGTLAGAQLGIMIAVMVPLLIAPLGSWREISLSERLRVANARLKELSETDPLTGTLNRRRFFELAGQQLTLAARHCYPTSLLLLDFDHFKSINDRHGHALGDQVLIESMALIREICRESDLLARFGGEEFILLLPHTAREGAVMVAERIMERLRDHVLADTVSDKPLDLRISVSIGGITSEASDSGLDTMMSHADALLYQAKQLGRDTCLVDTLPAEPLMRQDL